MLNQELLIATIADRRDVLRHNQISDAEVIPELPPRQLCVIKLVSYSANTLPITCFYMEAVNLLASRQLLLYIQIFHLQVPPSFLAPALAPRTNAL